MALTRLRTGGIAANAVVAASIAPGAVDITDIADNAITEAKLAANAVTTVKIAANAVTAPQIAPDAIPPSIPTGTIATFASDPGAGWLECNGQVVSQSTYSDLYSKVGLLADGFSTTTYITSLAKMDDAAATGRFTPTAYGNSTYVVGLRHATDPNGFSVYTSTNAVTWTARSVNWPSTFTYPLGLVYTDKFVMSAYVTGTALTNRNYFFTSTDGITWTTRTGASSSGGYVMSLIYGNSTYVAVNSGAGVNGIQTSTDGITWTNRTLAVDLSSDGYVAYGNSVFVFQGYGPSGSTYRAVIQTSTDAVTWTYRSTFVDSGYPKGLTFANGLFYAFSDPPFGGAPSIVHTSTDGITWTRATSLMSSMDTINCVVYDSTNSLLYACGLNGNIGNSSTGTVGTSVIGISSDNGATWEVRPVTALVNSTVTTGGVMPAPINGYNTFYQFNHGITIANNKIFYGNDTRTQSISAAAQIIKALVKVIDSPYTYQTDTQFALPIMSRLTAGIGANPTLDAKQSKEPFASGKNVKYYIKT